MNGGVYEAEENVKNKEKINYWFLIAAKLVPLHSQK
jgi:hypothetical protein